jgi:hypothetical protein
MTTAVWLLSGYRNIAEPLIQMFKDELMSQVEQGLVHPVPPGALTPFISGVSTMPKDSISGDIRITVDYRELNKWLVGTIFPNKTSFEAVRSIPPGMNYFTMVDGLKGYQMIPIDEESMALTTFSTLFGLFQYTRLPMGINHSRHSFGSRYYQVFGDLPIASCVEDMCVYATTYPEMLDLSRQIMERADKHNVSFNAKKTIGAFAVEEGDFAGYRRVFHFRVLFFDPVGNYNRGVKIGKKTKSVKIKCKKKCLTPPPSIFSKKKAQKHSF